MSDNTETQESTEETPEEVVETKSDEQEEVRQWVDALAVAEDNLLNLLKDADDGSLEVKEMDNRDLPFTNTPSAAENAKRRAESRRTGGGPDPARPGMTYKFKTPEEAEAYGKKLGCSGFHTVGSMFMPCATHAEFMDMRGKQFADMIDLVDALKALPKAKNRAAALAHIKKRAKELGVEDKIPSKIFSSMPSEDMNMMKSDEEEDV